MKRFPLLFALGLLLLPAATLAQEVENAVFSVGTPVTDAHGRTWAYLLWQSGNTELLRGRTYALYAKDGQPGDPGTYQPVGQALPQVEPAVIETYLNRAPYLGDDLTELETRIDGLFEDILPMAGLTRAEKLSAIIQTAMLEKEAFANLLFLSRTHPTVGLLIGTAFMGQVEDTTTFEIRACPDAYSDADTDCTTVVGRITIDSDTPVTLEDPGAPVIVPVQNPMGHLNVRLRWSTPNDLREQALLMLGYRIYRVDRTFAEAQPGWTGGSRPAVGELAQAAIDTPASVGVVNTLPVLTDRDLSASEAADLAGDPDTYFYVDDGNAFRGGSGFQSGDQFYYYVVAMDVLKREGKTSFGTLTTICDRRSPPATKAPDITNDYVYDDGTNTSQQALKIRWEQIDNSTEGDGDVTHYYVYRWRSPSEMQKFGGDPFNPGFLIAGPIPHLPGQKHQSLLDVGLPGSPTMPGNAGETYFYTVRAADSGPCGENIGPNGSGGWGVLRDRVGPDPAGGTRTLPSCLRLSFDNSFVVCDESRIQPIPENTAFGIFRCVVTANPADLEAALDYAEFAYLDPATGETVSLATVHFTPGSNEVEYDTSFLLSDPFFSAVAVRCRVALTNGDLSDWNSLSVQQGFEGAECTYEFNAFLTRLRSGSCEEHDPTDPLTGSITGIQISFTITATTKEYKIYRRVDNGPLTMIFQDTGENWVAGLVFSLTDADMPANGGTICYYVQLFDEHGNPSPMTRIGCVKTKSAVDPAVPMLTTIDPAGDSSDPQAIVRWFCAPHGVDRFRLFVAASNGEPPVDISPELDQPSSLLTDYEGSGMDYRHYRTGRPEGVFGLFKPEYKVTLDVEEGVTYSVFVKAVDSGGKPGAPSNIETFRWGDPTTLEQPQVPWPARDLPKTTANTFSTPPQAMYVSDEDYQGPAVLIGESIFDDRDFQQPYSGDSDFQLKYLEDYDTPANQIYKNASGESLLPMVLYRYQVPSTLYPSSTLSGDIVQVSPLIEEIAATGPVTVSIPQTGQTYDLYAMRDPFLHVMKLFEFGLDRTHGIFVKDTQPAIRGAAYVYLLVRFSERGEIVEVVPTSPLLIP